ncbi:MAG TPA: hypothetical protein VFF13_02635 [archaeon]|nr:hypothetical protein [archaeon]
MSNRNIVKWQNKGIMRFFGVMKDSDWSARERRMGAFRKSFEERLKAIGY